MEIYHSEHGIFMPAVKNSLFNQAFT